MFVQAILNGKGDLSPTSLDGWDLYHVSSLEGKNDVDATSKLRTCLLSPTVPFSIH